MFLLLAVRLTTEGLAIRHLATDVCTAVVVLAGVSAACTRKHSRVMALILGTPVLLLTVWAQFETPGVSHQTFVLMRALMTMFLGFTTVTILQDLIDQRKITRDTLVGAFCGYVLIGATWTEMYCWIDLVAPNSFSIAATEPPGPEIDIRWNQLLYFSFVTLSTVGYGDVTPASPLTRMLACLEAICGQFYLAVLVAGLVSIRVAQLSAMKPPDSE